MKKSLAGLILASGFFAMSVSAATLISKEDASKYESLGHISVGASGGTISSPTDLHEKLSELAEAKGGKYYTITAAREHGPNFEATAEVFK